MKVYSLKTLWSEGIVEIECNESDIYTHPLKPSQKKLTVRTQYGHTTVTNKDLFFDLEEAKQEAIKRVLNKIASLEKQALSLRQMDIFVIKSPYKSDVS